MSIILNKKADLKGILWALKFYTTLLRRFLRFWAVIFFDSLVMAKTTATWGLAFSHSSLLPFPN